MPISTLCWKSMPSTCSRKPWTKCWRDCSPSVTMSRPASSCALIHSSVASALASRSASPSARHCGQSLWVSASQPGLGRLPAMEVGNIVRLLGDCGMRSPHDGGCAAGLPAVSFPLTAMLRTLPDPEQAKPCVLVIDDDEAVARAIAGRLGRDFRVVGTSDPEQAVPLAREEKPGVILCDINMPRM